jgi:hypothetical protein
MFVEIVMVLIGSLGMAFSIYGKYRYRHYESLLSPRVARRSATKLSRTRRHALAAMRWNVPQWRALMRLEW